MRVWLCACEEAVSEKEEGAHKPMTFDEQSSRAQTGEISTRALRLLAQHIGALPAVSVWSELGFE